MSGKNGANGKVNGRNGSGKPNGFPHTEHLTGLDFLKVMAKGEKRTCHAFHVYLMHAEEFQAGVCVSRKLGGAVVRNRIKRVLREAIRHIRQDFEQPCHMVVVARPGVEQLDLDGARGSLLELCGGAKQAVLRQAVLRQAVFAK